MEVLSCTAVHIIATPTPLRSSPFLLPPLPAYHLLPFTNTTTLHILTSVIDRHSASTSFSAPPNAKWEPLILTLAPQQLPLVRRVQGQDPQATALAVNFSPHS